MFAMFERFTEQGRNVVVLAQEEARRLRHNYVGTEHLLLGLLRPQGGIADETLASFGLTAEDARARIVAIVAAVDSPQAGQVPFTPRAKKVVELALREALIRGHKYIGAEHVLLGLLSEVEGVVARVLNDAKIDVDALKAAVLEQAPREPRAAAAHAARQDSARRHLARADRVRFQAPGFKVTITPDPAVDGLLKAASARALHEQRTEFTVRDLLIVVRDDPLAREILDELIAEQ